MKNFIIFIAMLFLTNCAEFEKTEVDYSTMIAIKARELQKRMELRTVDIEIPHRVFWDNKIHKRKIRVLDVCAQNIRNIFEEIAKLDGVNALPIYAVSSYASRLNRNFISLHQYAGAIDVNYYMNPYVNAHNGNVDCIPDSISKKTFAETLDVANANLDEPISKEKFGLIVLKYFKAHPYDCDDRFINRRIARPGMIMPIHAQIFLKNGFNIWGGEWREPMDFMHFQMPRKLAEKLVELDKSSAQKLWDQHVKECSLKYFSPVIYKNFENAPFLKVSKYFESPKNKSI